MPNDDGGFVTHAECRANTEHMKSDLTSLKLDVDKILKILQGNGEGGLIWKVNSMMQRNRLLDKLVDSAMSVFLTLLTLYLTGVLHL